MVSGSPGKYLRGQPEENKPSEDDDPENTASSAANGVPAGEIYCPGRYCQKQYDQWIWGWN